ncbi:MAG TPA: bifunctional aldolase/short-chain dehydrogenase [Anaeromyxobacteraceae bacterium]|jgi:rhamnose utilization protein RhaD (predicted bifunctional aldolase and dehydrogenase)/NAD(P)-dependent dehydrogenase (short-subunit alcohol dehydrogenase family)
MKSQWRDDDAARFPGDLGLRVYTSRLLGRDPALVLHGGGNTSVKIAERNLVGEEETILHVKGSGGDLATIEASGFAPVRLAHLLRLAALPALSDPEMVNELRTHLTRAAAPTPSVEAILHALLPHRYVDHTHADAVVTVCNTPGGAERIREIYGEAAVVVPYVMPGFDLARACARLFPAEATPRTLGMVLLHHGIFTFGETARESYERMIDLVGRAEAYLARRGAWSLPAHPAAGPRPLPRGEVAALRAAISQAAGFPLLLAVHDDPRSLAFARRPEVAELSQQGPATPDHVIRTKRLPLLGRDVAAYAAAYRRYFEAHAPAAREPKAMLDPAPRVVLDPELGLCAAGRTPQELRVVFDVYARTMDAIERAALLGGWRALPARDLFEVEYWDLEQAKLRAAGRPAPLAGEVALVTGAASGIGKAVSASLLARGAAVVGLDVAPAVERAQGGPGWLGLVCDVTSAEALRRSLDAAARAFGGLDALVLNAGVFPGGRSVADLPDEEWRRVFSVNLDANLALLREAHPLLALSPRGGRVVVVGSKNVAAPGPGAAAYSASKAALTQLARVAALEWASSGIRVNVVHPDAVFDTGIWTPEVLEARARSYGMTVEQYRRRNLLGTEVCAADVGELAAELCGPLFAKTTGAQIPIDGGSDRVV